MSALPVSPDRPLVPACLSSPHFLYMAERRTAAPEDVALIMKAVQGFIDERGLTPAQIGLVREREILLFAGEEGVQAFNRLLTNLSHDPAVDSGAAVLFCEWARPHVDQEYWGTSFVSQVLSTGPEPYVVQTLHTGPDASGRNTVTSVTRVLREGDVMVFDPSEAHLTMPVHPTYESLLVMLQLEVPDRTNAEREALLARFAPCAGDSDAEAVFDGHF